MELSALITPDKSLYFSGVFCEKSAGFLLGAPPTGFGLMDPTIQAPELVTAATANVIRVRAKEPPAAAPAFPLIIPREAARPNQATPPFLRSRFLPTFASLNSGV